MVDKLNNIIAYVEEHITEKLDMDAIARIACLSAYDAQRAFGFIAGMSLTEYIRKRRLTLAGMELQHSTAKVIDVALKYGYDSPVSFAHAFRKFHGILPSQAKRSRQTLQVLPRLMLQITVKEVTEMLKSEKMVVNGKTYEASYFGEVDMSSWSTVYSKRQFWRLENAWEDFKDCITMEYLLPYNNYPAMDIQLHQVFVIDYFVKDSQEVERKYYVSNGSLWNDMKCTTEITLCLEPTKVETLCINGKEYVAEYYGKQRIGHWSQKYETREFWSLQNAWEDFKDKPLTGDVLPYNNYNPMKIELNQVFVVDYLRKDTGDMERRYYISNGRIWRDLQSTSEVTLS